MHKSDSQLPLVYLARHGETAWSLTGQHTGLTDLDLTEHGQCNARRLGPRLQGIAFTQVLTSPLQRAVQTCQLAGFAGAAQQDGDLVEWDYGQYEGLTPQAIHQTNAGWDLFRDGCPGGERLADVAARSKRVVERIRAVDGNVLIFSHSHFLHVLAACWLGLSPDAGRHFFLDTGALSTLGFHHDRNDPVVRLWNDCSYQHQYVGDDP